MSDVFRNGYALLIGVGADLPVTVQDATAISSLLMDPKRAAYPPEQITLLTETTARKQNILDAFDQLIVKVNADESAIAIVYFSGHGGRIERPGRPPEYYLMPYGYNNGPWVTTAILAATFTEKIESLKAKKLIVLLDCCHAAAMPVLKAPGESFVKSPVDLLDMLSTGSGRVIVASSQEQESSYTATPYSIFTTCLIEAMSGQASVNKDGYARILDILIYLFDQVPKRAAGPQHPLVKRILDLGDNFPVCYYAGGNKSVSGELTISETITTAATTTVDQRRRIQQKLDGFRTEWDLRSEKMSRIRAAMAIETAVLVKFQLEKQLLEEEAILARLGSEIEDLEQKLSG